MTPGFHIESFINALMYALLGIVLFTVIFAIADRMHPKHLVDEIVDGHNMPLAIVTGLIGLGLCIIIAAAIH